MKSVLIYTIGYEKRSAHVASERSFDHSIGIVPKRCNELHFDANLTLAKKRKSRILQENDIQFELAALLTSFSDELGHDIDISVDVSSMSRTMMALTLGEIHGLESDRALNIKCLYSLGKYQSSNLNDVPFLDLKPIVGLEGWTAHPERPLTLVVGLGYEPDLAVAALEYLDPSATWAFLADGNDPRYKQDVLTANASLFQLLSEDRVCEYDVFSPGALNIELGELVETLVSRSRVLIVAGGPKIFSAISILCKLELGDEVSVWKVSGFRHSAIRDIEADGPIVQFSYNRPERIKIVFRD